MSGLVQQPIFRHLEIKELHPTFGAEITGSNFQQMQDEEFQEILAAMAKASGRTTRPELIESDGTFSMASAYFETRT